MGEGVLFQVKLTGSPPPKLVWYHNGEEVVADYSREIIKDGSLTMPSVEVRHTGTYKVVAENVAGKKEGEVKLYVEDEEGMTKPKQGKGKPLMKTKDIPVAMFGRHVVQNHSKNNKPFKDEYEVPVFVMEQAMFGFYCSIFPLFRISMMGRASQLLLLLFLRTS